MKLTDVIAEGDLRASLEATRDFLAAELEHGAACKDCGGALSSPTASLAKQLVDVLARIDALPDVEVSRVDDIARKRTERLSATGASQRTAVQRDSGRRSSRVGGGSGVGS